MTQAQNVAIESSQINSSGVLLTTGGGTGLSTVGTNGQVLTSNGTTLSWVTPTAVAPGGSSGYVQYNNGTTFAGSANLYWDNTNARLGIGTASPDAPLTLKNPNVSGNQTVLDIVGATSSTTLFGVQANQTTDVISLGSLYAGQLAFVTNSTERMRIDTSGNVLVGTTALATGFSSFAQIEASGSSGGIVINSTAGNLCRLIFTKGNAFGNEGLIRYDTTAYSMQFWTNATQVALFDSSSNFQIVSSGNILNAAGRKMLNQTGGILQVVQGALNTYTTTTSTSFVDTGITVTITPNSSSSKFFIQVFIGGSIQVSSGTVLYNLVRNGTAISQPASGSAPASFIQWPNTSNASWPVSFGYVDSPATASAITYKVQWRVDGGTGYLNRHPTNTDYNSTSNIIVQEIAG